MTFRQYGLLAAALLAVAFVVGLLAKPGLKEPARPSAPGDPAPGLVVKEWVKGGPVDIAAGKGRNVYLIEFWATWCAPCRASSPHLSELQGKYGPSGLTVVGVTDEDVDLVKDFVAKAGKNMDYAVAIDQNRATYNAYMTARGMKGIPAAFLVDQDGMIVWKGHPLSGLDEALAKVFRGVNASPESLAAYSADRRDDRASG